ncbi:MAG: hypothetical protein ACI9YM_001848 [Brevundimonas sp.]|jgi:hypothetical protein|uniref:hypothetical protein n=1 Tax=Brevundimonas sp. TaxID=1871086 RepID=UPI00248852C4|nr:hypothetical protein [Brevundimonas sp.]MDI1281034.1 hypothetical protein [Brevundimonas sp.]
MTTQETELDRLKARRVTTLFRLDMINQGARIHYEDGTPVDMASEKDRLDAVVVDLDRRIEKLERAEG